MHELGIAQDFLAVIKQQANLHGLKKISKIKIVLGEASGIELDFLKHSLVDHALPGTIAENAEIEFVPLKLIAQCCECKKEINSKNLLTLSCPFCGCSEVNIISGKEIYVESIEGE